MIRLHHILIRLRKFSSNQGILYAFCIILYNLELQAAIFLRKEEYGKAELILRKSILIADKSGVSDLAAQQMYLAGVYYKKGILDSALNMVRGVPERVSKRNYATALGYASDIYLANDIKDTAYMYAHILCQAR